MEIMKHIIFFNFPDNIELKDKVSRSYEENDDFSLFYSSSTSEISKFIKDNPSSICFIYANGATESAIARDLLQKFIEQNFSYTICIIDSSQTEYITQLKEADCEDFLDPSEDISMAKDLIKHFNKKIFMQNAVIGNDVFPEISNQSLDMKINGNSRPDLLEKIPKLKQVRKFKYDNGELSLNLKVNEESDQVI